MKVAIGKLASQEETLPALDIGADAPRG